MLQVDAILFANGAERALQSHIISIIVCTHETGACFLPDFAVKFRSTCSR